MMLNFEIEKNDTEGNGLYPLLPSSTLAVFMMELGNIGQDVAIHI